jgi:hypothetical protein
MLYASDVLSKVFIVHSSFFILHSAFRPYRRRPPPPLRDEPRLEPPP